MTINIESHINFFKKNGYTIFEGLYQPMFLKEWSDLVNSLKKKSNDWIFGNVIERSPVLFLKSITNSTIINFSEQIMGPFLQLDGLTIVGAPPLSEKELDRKVLHWHRDPWGHVPSGNFYERPLALNALCYLQDLDTDVGPLRVVPGSHKMEFLLTPKERKIPHSLEKLLYLKMGDVVVLHHNLVHSRTYNLSKIDRFYFSVLYNHSWLKQTTNLNGPMAKQLLQRVIENNDHRMMRLLGRDLQLESRGNSGFLSKDEEIWKEWIKEDEKGIKMKIDYTNLFVNKSIAK